MNNSNYKSRHIIDFVIAIILIAVFLTGTVSVFSASAGVSNIQRVSKVSFSDGVINNGTWKKADNTYISVTDDKMVFDENSSGEDFLTARAKLKDRTFLNMDLFFDFNSALNIEKIESGGRFSYCFGIKTSREKLSDNDFSSVISVDFTDKDNSLEVEINKYTDGAKTLLNSADGVSVKYGEEIKLSIIIGYDKKTTLKINGLEVMKDHIIEELPFGYYGLGQSGGKNKVTISDYNMTTTDYASPVNTGDYVETFDGGEYNANIWYSNSAQGYTGPSGVIVENDKLRFMNTAGAHVTTKYQYSNFELAFDLDDYQNYLVNDSEGNLISGITAGISLCFGVASTKQEVAYALNTTAYRFSMSNGSYWGGNCVKPLTESKYTIAYSNDSAMGKHKVVFGEKKISDTDINIWDRNATLDTETNKNKPLNIKLVVKDMQADAYIQFAKKDGDGNIISAKDATFGDPVVSSVINKTPTGHVRICCYGDKNLHPGGVERSSLGNFTIDNLSIKNLDDEAFKDIKEVDFKTNKASTTGNFIYTDRDDDNDLLINKLSGKNEKGCGGNIGGTLSVSIIALLLFVAVKSCFSKRKGEK